MTRTLLLLALLTPVVVVASAFIGPTALAPADVFAGGLNAEFFWRMRAPRALVAALAGAALASAGVVFQAVFRNPLAEPYTLGLASGASLGAAVAYLRGWDGYAALGLPRLAIAAVIGALGAMAAVYIVHRAQRERDVNRLLIAGVCVAYACGSGVLLITYLADRTVTNDIILWIVGSLARLRPQAALEIAVVGVPVLVYILSVHRALDLLHFGEQVAAARGVAGERTIWGCFLAVGVLTAVVVANCGPVGFVGLMAPHMARALLGGHTRPLIVGASLLGAAFLAVCDALARALPVIELPVGVVTNLLGAAFVVYLLLRGRPG